MATVALVGLIYMICEMYIDDCSVFGDTNIEFVSRLRLVFERFRKHNLYLTTYTIVKPLHDLIANYDKTQRIV